MWATAASFWLNVKYLYYFDENHTFFDIIIKVTITESDVCNCQIFNNSTVINITYAKKNYIL